MESVVTCFAKQYVALTKLFEAAVGEVLRPQRRGVLVQGVEVADQAQQALVARVVGQDPPVQGGVGVPLRALAELTAHEQQLLARVGPLIGVQG